MYGDIYDSKIYLGSGNDLIRIEGGGRSRVKGGSGKDRLYGGNGVDKFYGGKGKDRLYGGKGEDRLYGEKGEDRILGIKMRKALSHEVSAVWGRTRKGELKVVYHLDLCKFFVIF